MPPVLLPPLVPPVLLLPEPLLLVDAPALPPLVLPVGDTLSGVCTHAARPSERSAAPRIRVMTHLEQKRHRRGNSDRARCDRSIAMNRAALILDHTVVAAAPLVPELPLHLVTEQSPLWRASEADAAKLGLPLPYWAFVWPGGQALARLVLDRPELVRGKRVLDFGSGCAIEALAALGAGARAALASDIDPFAAEAARLNAQLHALPLETTTDDLIGAHGDWEVILAGDVFYERELVARVMSWLRGEAARGVLVLLGDPNRGWLDPRGLDRVASFMAAADGDLSGTALKEAVVWRVNAL